MTEPITQRTVRADFAAALESAFGYRIPVKSLVVV